MAYRAGAAENAFAPMKYLNGAYNLLLKVMNEYSEHPHASHGFRCMQIQNSETGCAHSISKADIKNIRLLKIKIYFLQKTGTALKRFPFNNSVLICSETCRLRNASHFLAAAYQPNAFL